MKKSQNLMERLNKRLTGARDALRELHGEAQELAADHADALLERARLLAGDPPPDDVIAGAEAFAAAARATLMQEHGVALRSLAGPYQPDYTSPFAPILHPPQLPDLPLGPITWERFAGLAPTLFTAFVSDAVRSVEYEAGEPIAARPRLVAEIDERIRDLEERHTALVDTAAELDPPIGIPLLETVRQRREGARVREERQHEAHTRWERDNSRAIARAEAAAEALEASRETAQRLAAANAARERAEKGGG